MYHLRRYSRLLGRLPHSAVPRTLALMTGPARKAPGSTEMAPLGAVLQQHAGLFASHEQSGRSERSPEPATVGPHDPFVAAPQRTALQVASTACLRFGGHAYPAPGADATNASASVSGITTMPRVP